MTSVEWMARVWLVNKLPTATVQSRDDDDCEVNWLETLKRNDADLVKHKRIIRSSRQRLVEKPLGKLGVVSETVLKADVQQRQMTPTAQHSTAQTAITFNQSTKHSTTTLVHFCLSLPLSELWTRPPWSGTIRHSCTHVDIITIV